MAGPLRPGGREPNPYVEGTAVNPNVRRPPEPVHIPEPREEGLPPGVWFHETAGVVWTIELDDTRTHELRETLGSGTGWLVEHGISGLITFALQSAIDQIELMDKIGGHNGVKIVGVYGANGLVVTPRFGNAADKVIEAAKTAIGGRTVIEILVRAAASSPALANTLGMTTIGVIASHVMAGTPLGWAVAAGAGLLIDLLLPEPDPNQHGWIVADRGQALEWESFHMGPLGNGHVALLSYNGFLSAQNGGGAGVYANRPEVGDWERWRLLRHGDGTVSLGTHDGQFLLCAEGGGGREVVANRTAVGDWEKFWLEAVPDGRVALKSFLGGQYVSVQP